MHEQNNPVGVGKDQIRKYKEPVEELLTSYRFGGKTQSLPEPECSALDRMNNM